MNCCFCAHSSVIVVFIIITHQNDPLMSAEAVRHSSTYIILYNFLKTFFSSLLLQEW